MDSNRPPCHVSGCEKPSKPGYTEPICGMHRERMRRHGSYDNPRVRLDRIPNGHGYWLLYAPTHPTAKSDGYALEHRLVAFDALGPDPRPCHWCGVEVEWFIPHPHGLVIDHVDTNTGNNSLSNLVPSCNSCNASRRHWGVRDCNKCGREISGDNLRTIKSGNRTKRKCRICDNEKARAWQRSRRMRTK